MKEMDRVHRHNSITHVRDKQRVTFLRILSYSFNADRTHVHLAFIHRSHAGPMQKPSPSPSRQTRGSLAHADGLRGEDIARQHLLADGWHILLHRARTPCGEIDLVASKNDHLAFIEVKKRANCQTASEAITMRQRRRLMAAAELLLTAHPEWTYEGISFDVIAIASTGSLRHIRDAFRQE